MVVQLLERLGGAGVGADRMVVLLPDGGKVAASGSVLISADYPFSLVCGELKAEMSRDDEGVIVRMSDIDRVIVCKSKRDALFMPLMYKAMEVEDFSGVVTLLGDGESSMSSPTMYGLYSFERLRLGICGGWPLNAWEHVVAAPMVAGERFTPNPHDDVFV
ncbi:hypothetical protein ACLOJK_014560 [Asimina triloba]